MKKLSIIMSIVVASLLVFTTSCGTSSSSSPADISKNVIKNMENGNFDDVIDILSTNGKELSEEDNAKLLAMLQMAQDEIKKKDGIKSVEILEENINEAGDKATIKFKTTYGNGKEENQSHKYIMEDGKWKLTMK